MRKLTENQLNQAENILERYRNHLLETGQMNARSFESDLRKCWDTGYQTIKQLALALSKIRRYRIVAAYYMEHIYPGGPAAEFKPRLAAMYGTRNYHCSKAMTEKREAFWSGLFSEPESES